LLPAAALQAAGQNRTSGRSADFDRTPAEIAFH
jgi:hypothetical protein